MSDVICDIEKCGSKCCTTLLPTSNKEIKRIKKYIRQNNITCTNWNLFQPNNTYIDKCPFLNEQGLCKIYEVRPEVCREYMCGEHISKFDHSDKFIVNFYDEFFPVLGSNIKNKPDACKMDNLYQSMKKSR